MTNDGGQAFPCNHNYSWGNGMTLRDWFAGQALAGLPQTWEVKPMDMASYCYSVADAMIAEREKHE